MLKTTYIIHIGTHFYCISSQQSSSDRDTYISIPWSITYYITYYFWNKFMCHHLSTYSSHFAYYHIINNIKYPFEPPIVYILINILQNILRHGCLKIFANLCKHIELSMHTVTKSGRYFFNRNHTQIINLSCLIMLIYTSAPYI